MASRSAAAVALADRVMGSYYGLLIGDSLSMPVHWYYNPSDIVHDYGKIVDFQAPKPVHPSSILNLSNTAGAGRGSQAGSIIGDVINHGKKKFWGSRNVHYHHGMVAGENTLNSIIARLLVRGIVEDKTYDPDAFLSRYVTFMTTPGSHNDVYAESWHRIFFSNYVQGKPPRKCAGDDGHNIASAGGLVLLPPVALWKASTSGSKALSPEGIKGVQAAVKEQTLLTHRSDELVSYTVVYAELLAKVLMGQDLRESVAAAGKAVGFDVPRAVASMSSSPDTAMIGGKLSPACYIEGSFPAMLYLAYKYADSPENALIANTNVGGENCHRGSALGALMGASKGLKAAWPERWVRGLHAADEIATEATQFAELLAGAYDSSEGLASSSSASLSESSSSSSAASKAGEL